MATNIVDVFSSGENSGSCFVASSCNVNVVTLLNCLCCYLIESVSTPSRVISHWSDTSVWTNQQPRFLLEVVVLELCILFLLIYCGRFGGMTWRCCEACPMSYGWTQFL
ncbi:hypothetical protein VPH35_112060 [Triticum aestivum]